MNDTTNASYAALLLRVSLGLMFLAHGLVLKVLTFTIPGTVGYFQSIGVRTRLISLLLLPILIGATLQHTGNGWVFSNQGGGWEFPVFWTVALLVQALLGAGAYAVKLPAPLDVLNDNAQAARA
jgi:putative oxidoreductase